MWTSTPALLATIPIGWALYVRTARLSQHFTLWEMIQSDVGGVQWPSPIIVGRLRRLTETVLEPWRRLVGPLRVTSGYRTWRTNTRIPGSSSTSVHPLGLGVDVVPLTKSIPEAAKVLEESTLPYDQIILYSGHIHVGLKSWGTPRRQVIDKRG